MGVVIGGVLKAELWRRSITYLGNYRKRGDDAQNMLELRSTRQVKAGEEWKENRSHWLRFHVKEGEEVVEIVPCQLDAPQRFRDCSGGREDRP